MSGLLRRVGILAALFSFVVVTAPVVLSVDSYYGPPVMAGPTIGLTGAGGAGETATGRSARRAPAEPPAAVPEETVPKPGAGDGKGLTLRVRGAGR